MYSGKVEICGVNTAQLPVLSERQKTELLRAARAGNAAARQKMIQGNLRLVLSVVQNLPAAAKTLTICFRWAALVLSRPLITLTRRSTFVFPPTACR